MGKRAEEAALIAYPVCMGEYSDNCKEYDTNESDRLTYQEGYEKAEKETIERAAKWLREETKKYVGPVNEPFWGMFLSHFRKAME